jgi:glycosyltransferase involved in cell wall biosynthesis
LPDGRCGPECCQRAPFQRGSSVLSGVQRLHAQPDRLRMKISVLLANYNHASTLRRCVAGIQAQSHSDWELVIVDDASTDESPEILRDIAAADDRVRVIFRAENGGAIWAYTEGFGHLSGDLFLGIAADDYLTDTTFMARAAAEIMARPGVGGLFAKCRVIDGADGRELWLMGTAPHAGFIEQREAMASFFAGTIFIPGASAVWRLDRVREVGFYDPALGPQCDYLLNHLIPVMSSGVIVDESVVAVVTASPGSYSAAATDEDFIRRHALVERAMRSVPAAAAVSREALEGWRDGILDNRFGVSQQRRFFTTLDQVAEGIPPYLRSGYPQAFLDLVAEVQDRSTSLRCALADKLRRAHDIFSDVGSALPPSYAAATDSMWNAFYAGRHAEAISLARKALILSLGSWWRRRRRPSSPRRPQPPRSDGC